MAVYVERQNNGFWRVSRYFSALPAAMLGVSKLEEVNEAAFEESEPSFTLTPSAEALLAKASEEE
jgi:hypothetical protein